jgi:excisionase family DNA binding protein
VTCSSAADVDRQADIASMRCLTVDEVAALLRISKQSVYRAIRAGQIPSVRIGKSPRIPEEQFRRLISGGD